MINTQRSNFDALIIGGGLFGCHAALFLASKGQRVALVEQEASLIQRASIVNQARLHAGYHYPRSIATARASDSYIQRFSHEFASCINDKFVHYYAIARRGSLTDAQQFKHFCDYLNIACDPVNDHAAFNYDQLEAVFACEEYSFDPLLLGEVYRNRVADTENIKVFTRSFIKQVFSAKDGLSQVPNSAISSRTMYGLCLQIPSGEIHLETPLVVNATYASINSVNQLFGFPGIPIMHEIAEMAFVQPHE
ncbi:MAG: FAD-dependent oxidoreductase, partial [Bacteroidota bacterium]